MAWVNHRSIRAGIEAKGVWQVKLPKPFYDPGNVTRRSSVLNTFRPARPRQTQVMRMRWQVRV